MSPSFLLAAWFTLPVLIWAALLCVRRRIHPALIVILCLACAVGGVFILANYVWALDAYLLAEVDKYEPGTPEAERASEAWASDTGRSFTLLLSPVLTALWYGILFVALFGLQWAVRSMYSAKQVSLDATSDTQPTAQRDEDGNPYQPPVAR